MKHRVDSEHLISVCEIRIDAIRIFEHVILADRPTLRMIDPAPIIPRICLMASPMFPFPALSRGVQNDKIPLRGHSVSYALLFSAVKTKQLNVVYIALYGKPTTKLQSLTCHMGSYSLSCHLTEINAFPLNFSQTGRYPIYLRRRDGRLS